MTSSSADTPHIPLIVMTADLSTVSGLSVPHAIAFGRRFGSTIEVLHAAPPAAGSTGSFSVLAAPDKDKWLTNSLRPLLAPLQAYGVETKPVLLRGDVDDVLREAASTASLVITTKHGGGDSHGRVGSKSINLARTATAPILVVPGTVPEGGLNPEPPYYETIAVTTDFSEESLAGVRHAVRLARAFRAALLIINVVQARGLKATIDGTNVTWPDLPEGSEARIDDARYKMAEQIEIPEDVAVEQRVVMCDDVATGITGACVEGKADLLVIPSHGMGRIATMLLGSATESVLQRSKIPVLVLRRQWLQRGDAWK